MYADALEMAGADAGVTITVFAPPEFGGVVAVMVESSTRTMFVAEVPPNVTVGVPEFPKPTPVIVTLVLPVIPPRAGVIVVIAGAAMYVNELRFDECEVANVTDTFCAPTVPAGVVAVMVVASTLETFVAQLVPTKTIGVPEGNVPVVVMVMFVPPVTMPVFGAMEEIAGVVMGAT